MAPMSLATMIWYSNSVAEPRAYPRKRAKSRSLRLPRPSTMLVGIDIAARFIWTRRGLWSAARISATIRFAFSARACAFLQTRSFLKSAMVYDGREGFIGSIIHPRARAFSLRVRDLSRRLQRLAPSFKADSD